MLKEDLETEAAASEKIEYKTFKTSYPKYKPLKEDKVDFIQESTEQPNYCKFKSNSVRVKASTGKMYELSHTTSADLLRAVQYNDESTIKELITYNKDFISYTYPAHNNKTIIQIAVSNIFETILNDTVQLLIDFGADLHLKNESLDEQQVLHIATVGQNSLILQTILNKIEKDRVNDVTSKNENALHLLLRKGKMESKCFWECLDLLLRNDININQEDENGNTPILIAMKKRSERIITKFYESGKYFELDDLYCKNPTVITNAFHQYLITLIKAKKETEFLNHPHLKLLNITLPIFENQTLLQMSCRRNLEEIVKFLLLINVDVNEIGKVDKETPLEIATNYGFYSIFKMLLEQPSCSSNIPDNILVTAFQNAIYFPNVDCGHKQCLQYLLNDDKGKISFNAYKHGNTALHYAVKYSDCETIINLLKRGASLGNKNRKGVMAVDNIYPQTLERHLNNCIETTNNVSFDRKDTVVTFNYKTLLCSEGNEFFSETDVFLSISKNADLKHLLKHPVINAFLFLKWYKMKLFFNLNLLFYIIFFLSLIAYAFVENSDWLCSTLYSILASTFTILIVREAMEILVAPITYATDPENYLELCLIITTSHIIFAKNKTDLFNREILAISIILASIELMFLLGRYPFFSTYITVFKIVTWNFFKFMLWLSALFVGFTLGFYIIYRNNETDLKPDVNDIEGKENETDFFADPSLTFIKIMIMSVGELDARSIDLQTPLNKVFFLLFLFLVTITLYNVLNGLAVSDIQAIKDNAEIVSLVTMVNRIAYFENMFMGNSKEQVPTWLTKRLFLFSSRVKTIQMMLFQKGKILDDDTLHNENSKSCIKSWRFNNIYMESNVVKSTKKLILRNLTSNEPALRQELEKVRNNVDQLLGYFSRVKCN